MMLKKKGLALAAVVLVSILVVGCTRPAPTPTPTPTPTPAPKLTPTPTPTPAPKPTPTPTPTAAPKPTPVPAATPSRMSISSTAVTSSAYPQQVAMVEVMNKYVPGLMATLIEGGGSVKATQMLQQGVVQIAFSCTASLAYDAYNGVGAWKGNPPFPNLRYMLTKAMNPTKIAVREDSGVKTIADLQGKKFSFGLPGSSDYLEMQTCFNALGVKPDLFVGSYDDAIAAIKDRRIIGISKGGPGNEIDSALQEVAQFTKLRVLSFTKEEVDKIKKAQPALGFVTIQKGSMKVIPDNPEVTTIVAVSGTAATPVVSQEMMYNIMKALCEQWKEKVVPAFPGGNIDVVAETLRGLEAYDPVSPLHAGTVQYLLEKGMKIPARLIPPEYKK